MTALLRMRTRAPTELAMPSAGTLGSTGEPSPSPDPRQAASRSPAAVPSPPDPEDDESGRGVPRFGPALLVGVIFWAAVVLLLR